MVNLAPQDPFIGVYFVHLVGSAACALFSVTMVDGVTKFPRVRIGKCNSWY